jgi:hypothetical protein
MISQLGLVPCQSRGKNNLIRPFFTPQTIRIIAQPSQYQCTARTMARRPLASPSSDGTDVDHWAHLELEQREREPSVGNFNLQNESPMIVEWTANRLHEKLSQIDTLPRKWMTQDELYYMAKTPDLWPWQRTDPLTPTPPDTPNSILGTLNSATFPESTSWLQTYKNVEQGTYFQQNAPPSKLPRSRHNLRNRQSSAKRTKGGIQKKKAGKRKHTMVTRSRCQGRCCRGQVAG